MLIFVVLCWTSAGCIVGEYIFAEIRLLTSAVEFEMVSRDIGESQKLRQKSPKRNEKNGHESGSFIISRADNTLFQQLSLVQGDWGWKRYETFVQA